MPDGFSSVLGDALRHFEQHGYTSQFEIDYWLRLLQQAAERELPHDQAIRDQVRKSLETTFRRYVDGGKINELVPGVARYTIDQVKPHLRAELDRRIVAAVDRIVLNKKAAVEKSLQRFQGWSTAIPAGGGVSGDTIREAKATIKKPIAQVRFEARRVAIDQGHKLIANVADVVARGNGAIAGIWHSHWRRPGYNYRPDHKERDQRVYLIRGSWAQEQGLVKPGSVGYLDDITQAGQEPYCSCYVQYLSAMGKLPDEMLTIKGQEFLAKARAA